MPALDAPRLVRARLKVSIPSHLNHDMIVTDASTPHITELSCLRGDDDVVSRRGELRFKLWRAVAHTGSSHTRVRTVDVVDIERSLPIVSDLPLTAKSVWTSDRRQA